MSKQPAKTKSGARSRTTSLPSSVKGVRKASARRKKRVPHGQTVRFDFDSHGAHAAYVDVQDESTRAASDLIAAAIQQSWDELDED